ncbi:DUF2142 domain-containing protein [Microbacterium sp. NPDC058021]|uniref:DUF2142 domain-containing protein n=1 Tax=Microbacterium sp. NPDC058021 TaxID=3346306 RepID=UPI0036DDAD78
MTHTDTAPDRTRSTSRRSPWVTFTAVWLILTVVSSLWSLATPVAGSPDEPAHLIKAASVARGQWVGEYSPRGHIVQVPEYIGDTHGDACFAFDPFAAADCAVGLEEGDGSLVDALTTAGLYNPLYYVVVGWPSLVFDDVGGIYAMRIMSGLLCSLMAALAFMALRRLPSPRLPLVGFWIAMTPMAFFLFGSVNPNGFEAAAVLCFFAGMLALMHSGPRERITSLAVITGVGFAAAANARGLSLLWLVAAALIAVIAVPWKQFLSLFRRRAVWILLLAFAATGAIALAWLLGTNSLGTSTIDAEAGFEHPSTGGSFVQGFLHVLMNTLGYAEGVVGLFGWQETRSPVEVYFVWAVASGALVLFGLAAARGRALAMLLGAVGLFLFLPALVQGIFISSGGIIWQGRYNLPLFMCLVIAAALAGATQFDRLPQALVRRLIPITFAALVIAHLYAFTATLHRYAVGFTGSWTEAFLGSGWQAPGGNVALFIAMAAVGAAAVFLGSRALSRRDAPGEGRRAVTLPEPQPERVGS